MARLIVNRESNFGFYEWVNLFVDGTQVGILGYGSGYDAALTPGKHVLSITTTPEALPEGTPKPVTIATEAGKTYSFTLFG